MEQEADRLRLDLQWNELIASRQLLILDEAQSWPAVFNRLRGTIDADRKRHGRFLLLGSVSPALMTQVSESLAGRLSILELSPFIWPELPAPDRHKLWLTGGYPDGGVIEGGIYPRWQQDYLTILAQRDLPNWGLPTKPQTTTRFLRMIAALHAQSWNASQVGQAMGLDSKTVTSYLDFLAGAFLIRQLQPYQANIKKRLVKSPKIFWRDSGLLHAILNVPDQHSLLVQPWVGASWEGFVIEQIIGTLAATGHSVEPYYFRTSDQHEIDLILDFGNELWAIEVKLTSSPSPADIERLNRNADLVHATQRFLISQTPQAARSATTVSSNLDDFLRQIMNSRPDTA